MGEMDGIAYLKIKGGIFNSEAALPLFQNDKAVTRCSLLYGKNGSGKSTVAKGFRKIAGEDEKHIESALLIDKNNMPKRKRRFF